jgi:hypothetical protein
MTVDISLWWQGMSILEKIYWFLAIPFSVLFVVQTLLTFIGGDGMGAEGDADVAVEGDTGIDFQFLSIKNLIAFFTIFGWVGIVALGSGSTPLWSGILATLSGLLMMTIMASLMYLMGKLAENGTIELKKSVGKIGTVYLPIPPHRKGMGKVQINQQGFQTLDAMSDEDETIATGAIVEVISVINNEILVVRNSSKQ